MVFALKMTGFRNFIQFRTERGMNSSSNQQDNSQQRGTLPLTLETIIAVGLFGWLALSMTLMGLGIW